MTACPLPLQARVNGNVTVSFFDAEAGWTAVQDYDIIPRTQEQVGWGLCVSAGASSAYWK
jgi:hypothetical protein